MRISVYGCGYVGLTTAVCFADKGHDVIGVDNDKGKIKLLQNDQLPIKEPLMPERVRANVHEGRLRFTDDMAAGARDVDVAFFCVGTPPREDGSADISALLHCARTVIEHANTHILLVEKSTVPAGTAEAMKLVTRQYANGKEFDVATNPEFLKEGSMISDFNKPDRIVIGTSSSYALTKLTELYRSFNAPIIPCDMSTAEVIKHGSNAFLSLKITYANLIAEYCEKAGADAIVALRAIGLDRRIGQEFLQPGIGYGGFCFPKDMAAFIADMRKRGVNAGLLEDVVKLNEHQRTRYVAKVESLCEGVDGKTLGVLGLAFKPNTDDMRLAPSIDIIRALQAKGAKIKAYDPAAMEKARAELPGVRYCATWHDAVSGADAMLLLTEWKEFENLDLAHVKSALRTPIVVDGRNVFEPERMNRLGFRYVGMGR